ncbi:MAG: SsrA-binding protein SmpB [bacterium]
MKIVATNKKAFHDYEILDKYEAGIVLTGDEVKSVRAGHISLSESFATVHGSEIFLINFYIAPYSKAYSKAEKNTRRSRKLLLHKREISKLIGDVSKKGVTIVPLKIYITEKSLIKVEIATAKHKKAIGKKRELKERDIKRQTEREIKQRLA